MFTLYQIAYANRKTIPDLGLLLKHKNGDFGAILVTGKAAPRRSLKWSVTYWIATFCHASSQCEQVLGL